MTQNLDVSRWHETFCAAIRPDIYLGGVPKPLMHTPLPYSLCKNIRTHFSLDILGYMWQSTGGNTHSWPQQYI